MGVLERKSKKKKEKKEKERQYRVGLILWITWDKFWSCSVCVKKEKFKAELTGGNLLATRRLRPEVTVGLPAGTSPLPVRGARTGGRYRRVRASGPRYGTGWTGPGRRDRTSAGFGFVCAPTRSEPLGRQRPARTEAASGQPFKIKGLRLQRLLVD